MNRILSELQTTLMINSNHTTPRKLKQGRHAIRFVAALAALCASSAPLVAQAPVAQSAFAQYLSTSTVSVGTVAVGGKTGDGGPAKSALLNTPTSVAYDVQGNLYICDTNGDVVREVNAATGNISTVAGNFVSGFTGDGGPATSAELAAPNGAYVDSYGNIYIGDTTNNRIREVTASNGFISTIIGNATSGYGANGQTGPKTSISLPNQAWVDPLGNVFYSSSNSNYFRVLVNGGANNGLVYSVAGDGSSVSAGDNGPALSAGFKGPHYGTVNSRGDLILSDKIGDEIRIVPSIPYIPAPRLHAGSCWRISDANQHLRSRRRQRCEPGRVHRRWWSRHERHAVRAILCGGRCVREHLHCRHRQHRLPRRR